MRVLHWFGLFAPRIGGIEVLGRHLVEAMCERGHRVMVVTDRNPPSLPAEETLGVVPVHRFPLVDPLAMRSMPGIHDVRSGIGALKRSFRPDLVHLHSVGLDAFFHLQTRDAWPCPTLLTVHGTAIPYETAENTLFGRLLTSCDRVVGVSHWVRDHVTGLVPAITERSVVIHNGLPPRLRERVAVRFDPPVLLCLGRLVPEKGFDIVLRALPEILEVDPRCRLIIAGDGPERGALELLALGLGVAERVEFAGWVPPDEVPDLIDGSSLVVVPSRWAEPFGLVVLQAAQSGRPVVCAGVGGMKEVLQHDKSALFFERGSVADLARRVTRLLREPDTAGRLAAAALHTERTCFSFSRCVEEYDALYHELGARADARTEGTESQP